MAGADQDILRYQMLVQCFRSGQMNARQMQAHMAEDPAFRAFVLRLPGMRPEEPGQHRPDQDDDRSP